MVCTIFLKIETVTSYSVLLLYPHLQHRAHDGEDEGSGDSAKQNTGDTFDSAEQAPPLRQQHVAVTNRGIARQGKIERGFEVLEQSLGVVEGCPHSRLNCVQEHDPGEKKDHDNAETKPGMFALKIIAALQQPFGHEQHSGDVKQQAHEHNNCRH